MSMGPRQCSARGPSLRLGERIDPFPFSLPPDDDPSAHQPVLSPSPAPPPPSAAPVPQPPTPQPQAAKADDTHDLRSLPSPDLSRSSSARGASRLSSSFFPALAKARLALSSASSSSPSSVPRDMRSSSAREPPPKPRPILVLKLSGSSFLDTIIRDDKNKDPIYILETVRELTNVYRLDHPRDEPVKAATVQWPLHPVRTKGKTGRSIQFGHGSWREAEDLLKTGPLGSTAIRKFSIPHYPNSLKWKLIPGNCFCCVTSAVKGPVAVLDAATLSAPPRLKVYHPLIERDVARSQDNYKGVPTVFLDYLIVTSLLLVTDVQEWLDRPRETRIPGSSSYTIQRWLALIHDTPAPPEPDHPTVDLSLTVPSTPPHSATFPSPGGFWETQSGVTSLSGTGSNGSGSGGSYAGEPFTPTTPITSATSANSSTFFPRSAEDAPPVPSIPGSSSSGASPFAHTVDPAWARERPKSNPQAMTHSASSSTSTMHSPPGSSHPFSQTTDDQEEQASHSRARSAHTLSLPGGGPTASSTSAPTSPLPMSASSGSSSSSRLARRQLPVPPGPAPANSFAQPWLYSAAPSASPSTSSPTPVASPASPPPGSANSNSAARAARASMRGSLRTIPIPPPPPPPQHSIPLPPKLAHEQQSYASARPRTAPDLDGADRRRRSDSYTAGHFGEPAPEDDISLGMHPYASAGVATFSVRGRGVGERDVNGLTGQMRGLSMAPGPSSLPRESRMHAASHIRAPSQPAPDYDAHSFVNMPPPPLPVPPSSSSGTGSRPLPRRQLTVVNADAPTPSPSDVDSGLSVGGAAAAAMCPPSATDLRLDPRMSYADSVYEMPPPAYDAIDFSVRFVPAGPSPSHPSHLTVVPAPLPVPPGEVGGEGQRPS